MFMVGCLGIARFRQNAVLIIPIGWSLTFSPFVSDWRTLLFDAPDGSAVPLEAFWHEGQLHVLREEFMASTSLECEIFSVLISFLKNVSMKVYVKIEYVTVLKDLRLYAQFTHNFFQWI